MRLVFNRRGNASREKQTPVELEIYFNRSERKFIPSELFLYAGQFEGEQVVNHSQAKALNKQLGDLKNKYRKIFAAMSVDGKDCTLENLNERIGKSKKKEPISFLEFMYDRIAERDLRDSTKRTHLVAWEALRRFGGIKSFDSLTAKNLQLFDNFLRKEDSGRKQTTLHGYHKRIKVYVIEAMKLEYVSANPYNIFKDVRGIGKEREPLMQDELEKLRAVPLYGKLDKVRDLFVFGCYTGLAYSDIMLFCYDTDVVQSNGLSYIDGERLKTGTKFYTPLLKPALEVLMKYKYKLPTISNQKYNDFLHAIEARIGLNKSLTSHIARHTFATTVTLANDVPIESVSRMLGHKDIKTTQIYAKVLKTTIERHTEKLSEII